MRTPSVKIETAIKKIRQFHHKQRRIPTYEEIAKIFKFASKRSSMLLIDRLVEAGLMEKDSKGRTTLIRSFLPLPMLGSIKAGYPQDAEEQLMDNVSFDEYLVDRPESSYLLQVSGDSMIGASIQDKDIVIVDKKKEPQIGDIVVAHIDNEFTLKYLRKEKGEFCLVPANEKYPVIYPKTDLSIAGVVVSVVRRVATS